MRKKIMLTESEKNKILKMHKSAIHSEKKIVNEATLQDVQRILIQKGFLPATSATGKPSDDNKLGPNTLLALKNALSPSSQGSANTATTTSNTASTTSNTATTTPSTASTVTNTGSPVKYPWIGSDGKESLESIRIELQSDPNLQKWLGELKNLSVDQLNKILSDFKSFQSRMSAADMDPLSNQAFLIAFQTIKDAISMKENSAGTQ